MGLHGRALRREDFEFGGLLGEGAFARVLHVRDKHSLEEYALKILDKRQIRAKDRTKQVIFEKEMLSSLNHPRVIKLHCCFQDDVSLYFVLELAAGGELADLITRMGVCTNEVAQFYAAEIVSTLEHLRSKRIAHRDIKPENLLLTCDGHLKITDFDAAVYVPHSSGRDRVKREALSESPPPSTSFSPRDPPIVGTAQYVAPEVLRGVELPCEGFALDLWALGCIVFQMLCGLPPFKGESEYLTFQRIIARDLFYPGDFPTHARDLVEGLLAVEPSARMGMESLDELKLCPFFNPGPPFPGFEAILNDPPPRLPLPRRPREDSTGSPPNDGGSHFDFASSAECTPEVGQGFLSHHATEVTLRGFGAPNMGSSIRGNSSSSSSMCVAGCKSGNLASSDSACGDRSHSACGCGCQAARSPPRSARSLCNVSQGNSETILVGSGSPRTETPRKHLPSWPAAGKSLISWQNWVRELSRLKILREGEAVQIGGPVLKRRMPCCWRSKKVLVLSDAPRLLVLNSAGLRFIQEIELRDTTLSLQVQSTFEFTIHWRHGQYSCCDVEKGAEEWRARIQGAHYKSLAGDSTCATLSGVVMSK